MKPEWWLTAAVSDDTLVAELLLRLKDLTPAAAVGNSPMLPAWGVRQVRSSVEKKRDARRRSPTTPLSWSPAAASPSHDSSADHPQPSDPSRSKISASTESLTTSSKRHSRKKTFVELQVEESSLLEERTQLNKELATLRLTLVEQRLMNDTLKRRKLEFSPESSKVTCSNASRQVKEEGSSSMFVLPDLNMTPDEEGDIFGIS